MGLNGSLAVLFLSRLFCANSVFARSRFVSQSPLRCPDYIPIRLIRLKTSAGSFLVRPASRFDACGKRVARFVTIVADSSEVARKLRHKSREYPLFFLYTRRPFTKASRVDSVRNFPTSGVAFSLYIIRAFPFIPLVRKKGTIFKKRKKQSEQGSRFEKQE